MTPAQQRLKEQYAAAAKYADFREMLEKQKGIDGIVVATPDHLHAVVAKRAMDMGKHVYVQKPLTWSVHEARVLRETALKNPKLMTQMGNQGHSSEGARLINEWIAAGVIGPVHEVHVWTNRPAGYWPQGVPRPGATLPLPPEGTLNGFGTSWSQSTLNAKLARAMESSATPDGLRWDLYLGPVKEDIPYHPIYHPFNWRGWTDFGMGALGDMGAHLIDHPFWALGLTYPTSIEATSSPFGMMAVPGDTSPRPQDAPGVVPAGLHRTLPVRSARGSSRRSSCSGTTGDSIPPRPDVIPDNSPTDAVLKSEGGVIFVGEKGVLMNDTYGSNPRIYPESLMEAARRVPKTMPRIEGSHEFNWVRAIKGETKTSSPLEYAAQLTETMLLGVVALRSGQGRKILYDGANMRITNAPSGDNDWNQYLTREYREGWEV